MAYMKVDAAKLDSEMTSLAEKLRAKGGTADQLAWPDGFEEAVDGLNTFTPPSSIALDPDEVYRTTRPKDWLPMPTPGDDEVYLLNLIPEGLDGAFTAQITFTGSCTVEFGNLVDGVFVAKESFTPTTNVRFFHTVKWDDYGDTTSEGQRQYLVRIKGTGIKAIIVNYDDASYHQHGCLYLVDAVVGMATNFNPGSSQSAGIATSTLRYVRYVGNGYPTEGGQFRYCKGLVSVSSEQPTTGLYIDRMFQECRNLKAISNNLLAPSASGSYTFETASAFSADGLELQITNAQYFLTYNFGTQRINGNKIDTSLCANFNSFLTASCVKEVIGLNISSMTNPANMFKNTRLLSLTFAGETTPGGWTIDCSYCIMSHKALVNMINSLPTATAPATITITGNPGASELTDEEIAVATAKNWTVTI